MFKEDHLSFRQRKYMKVKNIIGRALGGIGLVVLSPVYLAIIVAIKKEDGITAPVFFSQKRVGIHKEYFNLYKFRSMRTDTPHDKPTHLLENPDQYITKVGRFLRKSSLDELPQLWNIARGDMAVIGPRPALWNQDDLIAERDKYGANDVKPGLTGWAQINGRDELEIPVKARLDGEYVKKMGPLMDIRCFIGTVFSVLRSDGVVEGGTGAKKKLMVITNHSYMLWQFRRELIGKLMEDYDVIISTPFVGHSVKARGIARDLFGDEKRYVLSVQEITEKDILFKKFRWILQNEGLIKKELVNKMPQYVKRALVAKNCMEQLFD